MTNRSGNRGNRGNRQGTRGRQEKRGENRAEFTEILSPVEELEREWAREQQRNTGRQNRGGSRRKTTIFNDRRKQLTMLVLALAALALLVYLGMRDVREPEFGIKTPLPELLAGLFDGAEKTSPLLQYVNLAACYLADHLLLLVCVLAGAFCLGAIWMLLSLLHFTTKGRGGLAVLQHAVHRTVLALGVLAVVLLIALGVQSIVSPTKADTAFANRVRTEIVNLAGNNTSLRVELSGSLMKIRPYIKAAVCLLGAVLTVLVLLFLRRYGPHRIRGGAIYHPGFDMNDWKRKWYGRTLAISAVFMLAAVGAVVYNTMYHCPPYARPLLEQLKAQSADFTRSLSPDAGFFQKIDWSGILAFLLDWHLLIAGVGVIALTYGLVFRRDSGLRNWAAELRRGLSGEEEAFRLLSRGYCRGTHIYTGLHIPSESASSQSSYETDLIIVGRSGVALVEVKSPEGRFSDERAAKAEAQVQKDVHALLDYAGKTKHITGFVFLPRKTQGELRQGNGNVQILGRDNADRIREKVNGTIPPGARSLPPVRAKEIRPLIRKLNRL